MSRISSKSSIQSRGDSKHITNNTSSSETSNLTYRPFISTTTTSSSHSGMSMPRKSGEITSSMGGKRIDAILVYDNTKPSPERDQFLKNLKAQQLVLEEVPSVFHKNRMYVKVYAPNENLVKYMKIFGFSVKYEQSTFIPDNPVMVPCCETILTSTDPDPNHPDAQRAWASISREPPSTFTNVERSSLVFFIMQYINFGKDDEPYKVGLNHLLMRKDFTAAFPLHDGHWEWSSNPLEPLNDRQLLAKYWANFSTWYKEQPLYHVENYFGPEAAMYFAWLGFYNKMLLIASVFGLITFLYGFIHITYVIGKPIQEACESTLTMCPACKLCRPRELKKYCFSFHLAHFSDNPASMVYAVFMAFWATLFIEFWKREQNTLKLKWNVYHHSGCENYRPEFQASVHTTRLHPYTQELELYVQPIEKCIKLTCSILIVFILICIVVGAIFAVILYERFMKQSAMDPTVITVTSSCITLVVMVTFRWIYKMFAYRLTNWENPRTQLEFDKSYMFKMIVFSMVNSYGKLLYVAFFKGKFFTYPGDKRVRQSKFPLSSEVCDPTGCVQDIFILLGIIIVFKPLYSNLIEFITPIVKIWLKKLHKRRSRQGITQLPQWEEEFELNVTNQFTIMDEVEEMVLQFGFVTILAAAFPLAPLFCAINNIFEIKIDSSKVVKYYRRSKAVKSSSMHVWFDTLQALIYVAVMTNALYIGFTSYFIPEQVYFFNYRSDLSEFHTFQLSKFAVEDNYWPRMNVTECMYVGRRYPPEDKNAYQKTFTNYYILSCRLAFVIIFMITVFAGTALLAYAIPDIPKKVKDYVSFNHRKILRQSITQNFGPATLAVYK